MPERKKPSLTSRITRCPIGMAAAMVKPGAVAPFCDLKAKLQTFFANPVNRDPTTATKYLTNLTSVECVLQQRPAGRRSKMRRFGRLL